MHRNFLSINKKAVISNTALILPIYNSARHLPVLIPQLLEFFPTSQIIAVNDGSQDDSAAICRKLQVTLIEFDQNQGKGAALLAGMQKASQLGYLFAFSLDSDEQHKPSHIPQFLQKQNDSGAGMVLGKRVLKTPLMPWQRICSNKLTSLMVSLTLRQKVTDSQCGYRLYCLEQITQFHLKSERYQFETEILLKMATAGYQLAEVTIDTVYGTETSHISHLRDISNFIKILVAHWLLPKE
jgi:glycosyltransferase involved in cell wall biosynthesis